MADEPEPYSSLAALRNAHRALLERRRQDGETAGFLADVASFITCGTSTGVYLDAEDERWEAQNLLDFWSNELHHAQREVPDATLVDFDPTLAPELDDTLCPYLGLDAFKTSQHAYFFGRDHLVNKMLDQLTEGRLLSIVGPSDSGKSSILFAGLLPRLQAGAIPGSESWRYYPPMTPGSSSLESLAIMLQAAGGYAGHASPELVERLRNEPDFLAKLVGNASPEPAVIIIDQFEEIFTLCTDEQARQAFVDNLLHLLQSPQSRQMLILTMRSDWESNLMRLADFQALYAQSQVRVTPMGAAELRETIERPAALVGLKFEDDLVDRLVRDVLGEPAALPLLQFTLLKLWENRERNKITWAAYRRLGSGRQALANSADSLYKELSPRDKAIARYIFLATVRPGEGLTVVRDRVRRQTLYQIDTPRQEIGWVLDQLIQARLVRLIAGATADDDQIEIAHEALIHNWPRLIGWLEEERVARRRRLRLTTMAEQWEGLGRDPDALLRGLLLEEARQYDDLEEFEKAFVDASMAEAYRERREKEAARQRELEQAQALAGEQRQRARESARSARRLTRISTVLAIVFVVAVAAALLAFRNSQIAQNNEATAVAASNEARAEASLRTIAEADAREQRRIAEAERDMAEQNAQEAEIARQAAVASAREAEINAAEAQAARQEAEASAREAESRELAAVAVDQLNNAPQLSLLLALEAVNITFAADESVPAEATDALYRALQATQLQLTLSGHTDWVTDVAFSPDGARLATASVDTTVKVWDATSGQEVFTLAGHSSSVNSVAFSPDGRQLASGGNGGTIVIWDAITGRESRRLASENNSPIQAVTFHPDGVRLAAAYEDGSGQIWDVATGNSLLRLFGHAGPLNDVVFTHGGARLATASNDGSIIVYDTSSGTPIYSTTIQTGADGEPIPIYGIAFSPDDQQLATAVGNGTARIWEAQTVVFALSGHTSLIADVAYSPDGQYLATASSDGTVKVWQAGSQQIVYTLPGHSGGVAAVTFNPDGDRLATAGRDGTARVWNAGASLTPVVLSGHSAPVLGVAYSADGALLATAGEDKTAMVWYLATGAAVQTFAGHNGPVNDVAFNPGATVLATASDDASVRLWDVSEGAVRLPFYIHQEPVTGVAFDASGTHLATASDDGLTRLWDTTTHEIVARFEHGGVVNAVAFSPDGALLATAGSDNSARIWDVASGVELIVLREHNGPVNDVAFSPDGLWLATASGDGTARVWEIASEQLLRTLTGHNGALLSVSFSLDGAHLATGSVDRTARLWDMASRQALRTFSGHTATVAAVAFSPDGRHLVTAGFDRTAQIYELVAIGELIEQALTGVTRPLTTTECEQYLRGRPCLTMTIDNLSLPAATATPAAP